MLNDIRIRMFSISRMLVAYLLHIHRKIFRKGETGATRGPRHISTQNFSTFLENILVKSSNIRSQNLKILSWASFLIKNSKLTWKSFYMELNGQNLDYLVGLLQKSDFITIVGRCWNLLLSDWVEQTLIGTLVDYLELSVSYYKICILSDV